MSDLNRFLSSRNKNWSKTIWDGLIEAIEARFAPLEENLGIQREVTDAIIARGLTVIEQELAPIVTQADAILNNADASVQAKIDRFEDKITGGMVLAFSSSPTPIATSATIDLVINVADREFFVPTPYLALSRTSTVANWAIGRVLAFNRTTGALKISLEQVYGPGGPFNDWCLTSLPGATLLQKYYLEQTETLRTQVANDKAATGVARNEAAAAATAAYSSASTAINSRNAAQAALDDLRRAVALPLVPPADPVIGQIWWDGSTTRVFDGVGFVPTVTMSIGGRRYEEGTFGPAPDGIITVGGGFTAAMVFVNGVLQREPVQYIADSPTVTVLNAQEGDHYFVEAYLATDATDYDTKEQVNQKIATAVGAIPPPNTANVGAAMAAANGGASIADGDSFTGVLFGTSTMRRWTWGNIKTWLTTFFDTRFFRLTGGTVTGHALFSDGGTVGAGKNWWRGGNPVVWNDSGTYGINITGQSALSTSSAQLAGEGPAFFRDRGNHTGTQPLSTISGVGTASQYNVGSLGAVVPILSGANTWTGHQTFIGNGVAFKDNDHNPQWGVSVYNDTKQLNFDKYSPNWEGIWLTLFPTGGGGGYSAQFNGHTRIRQNLMVDGVLMGASKSFVTDHPLDPYARDLVFVSTETPRAAVEFWGAVNLVDGEAEVDIDLASELTQGTFVAFTQLAVISSLVSLARGETLSGSEIVDGKFTIYSSNENSNARVTWTVRAERSDPAMLLSPYVDPVTRRNVPEHDKPQYQEVAV